MILNNKYFIDRLLKVSPGLVASCFFLTLFGCSSLTKKKEPVKAPANVKKEFDRVQTDLAAGDLPKAQKRLEWLTKVAPETDLADDAWVQLGEIHFARGDFNSAYTSFMRVVNSDVFSPMEAEALLGAGKSLYRLGRLDEALALTSKTLSISGLSQPMRLDLYRLRQKISASLGDRMETLRSLAVLAQEEPDSRQRDLDKGKILEVVESRLTDEELRKVITESEFAPFKIYANLRLGSLAYEQKDFRLAKDFLSEVVAAEPNSGLAERAKSLLNQIEARGTVDPTVIGTVLPLSGRHAVVGHKTLRGLQLGLGIYGKQKAEFKLAVIDSEGNPDQARRGVERLVAEDHAIAVVGSLLSRTAVAVAAKAEELGIPSIGLSQKSGLTEIGGTVFRNALTNKRQVERLVKVATEELGFKRFAILFPNDSYGVEYANLFWDAVLTKGGMITAVQSYNPDATSFIDPVRRLVGTYYLEDRVDEQKFLLKEWMEKNPAGRSRDDPPEDLLPPIVDFEAIFIPDTLKAFSQIAPALAYSDVKGIAFLGTNIWNLADKTGQGEKLGERILFVDSFFDQEKSFKESPFFRDFKATFGEEPGVFEIHGYDAGLLLRTLIAGGARSRQDLTVALQKMSDLSGALGPLQMSTAREIQRPLLALTFKDREIVPFSKANFLNPTPTQSSRPSPPPPQERTAGKSGPAKASKPATGRNQSRQRK